MSDLDSFYSSRSEWQCRYRFAHVPTSMTLRMRKMAAMQSLESLHNDNPQLKRSHSLCSVRTYGIRKNLNHNDTLANTLGRPNGKSRVIPQPNHQPPHGGQTIAQLERDTLHNDIYRNSFSSRRGTRNFVINPLYTEHNTAES